MTDEGGSGRGPPGAVDVAKEAAREACTPLRNLHQTLESRGDIDANDVVAEAEYAAEEQLRTVLRDAYPAHTLRLEEDVAHDGEGEYTWVVDPLDGTDSFREGRDAYAVSIALYVGEQPVVGVVAAPGRDTLFSARDGDAPRCEQLFGADGAGTGDVFDPDWADVPAEASLVSGYDRGGRFLRRFAGRVDRRRRCSSAALNLCDLASGAVDGHWEFDTYPWDVAGGLVVARAAGATVTDPIRARMTDRGEGTLTNGGNYEPGLRPTNRQIPLLASPASIHEELLTVAATELGLEIE